MALLTTSIRCVYMCLTFSSKILRSNLDVITDFDDAKPESVLLPGKCGFKLLSWHNF